MKVSDKSLSNKLLEDFLESSTKYIVKREMLNPLNTSSQQQNPYRTR